MNGLKFFFIFCSVKLCSIYNHKEARKKVGWQVNPREKILFNGSTIKIKTSRTQVNTRSFKGDFLLNLKKDITFSVDSLTLFLLFSFFSNFSAIFFQNLPCLLPFWQKGVIKHFLMLDNLIQIYYVVVKLVGNSFRHDKLVRKVEDHNKEGVFGSTYITKNCGLVRQGMNLLPVGNYRISVYIQTNM